MSDQDFFLQTIWENYTDISKINLKTGEFRMIHSIRFSLDDAGLNSLHTINDFVLSAMEHHWIDSSDEDSFLLYMDLPFLREMFLQRGHNRLSFDFRVWHKDDCRWTAAELIKPSTFSEDDPWILCTWREADKGSCSMDDAIRMLAVVFQKILKIDITNDTHEEIKVSKNDTTDDSGYASSISKWFQKFALEGHVHPEDVDTYLQVTNLTYLRQYFAADNKFLQMRYRRADKHGGWRYVSMEIIPSMEYTHEHQVLMLYIRDLHDAHQEDLRRRIELEHAARTDPLTGLRNRYCYNAFAIETESRPDPQPMGVLFADINGLKNVNDTLGHQEGDRLIQHVASLLLRSFRRSSCYRLSGDEFLVAMDGIPQEVFRQRCEAFHDLVTQEMPPLISIGYAWHAACTSLENILMDAEANMYHEKHLYHMKYPDFVRKSDLYG